MILNVSPLTFTPLKVTETLLSGSTLSFLLVNLIVTPAASTTSSSTFLAYASASFLFSDETLIAVLSSSAPSGASTATFMPLSAFLLKLALGLFLPGTFLSLSLSLPSVLPFLPLTLSSASSLLFSATSTSCFCTAAGSDAACSETFCSVL